MSKKQKSPYYTKRKNKKSVYQLVREAEQRKLSKFSRKGRSPYQA